MAHEMSHVALNVFEDIGSNPVECNGEPFCYLLEQLLEDSAP